MAIGTTYKEEEVVKAIAKALEEFYGSLIDKIDALDIVKIMKRKNPYLYRAKAMGNASEIVENVLSAFVSSSEETIFGNCFFEPLAISASGGNKALAEGIDIMVEKMDEKVIYAVAVKSGTSVFNADSKKSKSKTLWQRQNWHNRQRLDLRHTLDMPMARRKKLAEENLRCTENWQESNSGQSLQAMRIFT